MEGERYNLAKAQEEAEKLKQNVESGEVSNYDDAEKLVEQESIEESKKETIALILSGDFSVYHRELPNLIKSAEISNQVINSPEIQAAAKEGILLIEYLDDIIQFLRIFNISRDFIDSDVFQNKISGFLSKTSNSISIDKMSEKFEKVKNDLEFSDEQLLQTAHDFVLSYPESNRILSGFSPEDFDEIKKIEQICGKPGSVLESADVKNAFQECFVKSWDEYGIYGNSQYLLTAAQKIIDGLSLDESEKQILGQKALEHLFKEINLERILSHSNVINEVKTTFAIPDDIFYRIFLRLEVQFSKAIELKEQYNIPNDVIIEMLKNELIEQLSENSYELNKSLEHLQNFHLFEGLDIPTNLQDAAKIAIGKNITSLNVDRVNKLKNLFKIPDPYFESPEIRKIMQEVLTAFIKKEDVDAITRFREDFSISEGVIDSPEVQKSVEAAKVFGNADVGSLDKGGRQIGDLTEQELGEMFSFVRQEFPAWQDEQTIAGPFQAGAETFGYKRMLEYIKRDDLSLHDAVHAFRDVVELYKASGLGEAEFFENVLQQVRMDNREYSEGTAHHHLNSIAQTANKNVTEVIAQAQEYREIERLQELAIAFETPQAVFASWTNLKRYSELEQLLGQTEVFDELKELKAEGKEALYRYIETLAFHPDSKVDMKAVMEFWRDPESFLAAEASHTPYEVHDRKKPSNYLHMPNLDLTAAELRDALVEGKMDGLSAFTPLEVRYSIPLEDVKSEPLPDLVNKALGSRKNGIKGAARNPGKLFSELGKLFKPHDISIIDYMQGKPLPDDVTLSQEIEALLYDSNFGMEKPYVKTRDFVARISQKSDPEGAIAGDDTVNCMPFGDGKNTLYTFNPNTAQFVIRLVKGDGKERTIAQSVLTKDIDVKTPVPDVISKLEQEGEHLQDILPADILMSAPVYAACDNVEVAPNYLDERHQQIIEVIFRDFFKEYMSRYAETEGLNPGKVPIGQGYTDALSGLPAEKNTFAPQAPVSYSDKTGADVYMLDLKKETEEGLVREKRVQEAVIARPPERTLPEIKGLGYLTFEDTLKVAYLEGKAYSDNQSLMQFLFDMENGLIAKDINNAAKDRPNMSLTYTDEAGKMRGYMLAWEGILSDENVEYDAEEFFRQPCIYITDIATDRENRMVGGRLMQGFAELYKQNYLDKGNTMPIFAQARESTSYQIVKKQLDKLGKDAGYDFELVELPTYEVGEDVMHPIIIRPVFKKG